MHILGFSIQTWAVAIAAIVLLAFAKSKKSKVLAVTGVMTALIAALAVGLQVSVWLNESNEVRVEEQPSETNVMTDEEREQAVQTYLDERSSKAEDLPAYEDIGSASSLTEFDFDCTVLNDAHTYEGTHYRFKCTYGNTDYEANMTMDYDELEMPVEQGMRLHVICRYTGLDYKGVPNFEIVTCGVLEQ